MASLRPKTRAKSKYNNGLPQFYSYKDKSLSNNYRDQHLWRAIPNFYYRYKMLVKAFFISIGIYFFFNWFIDSSVGFYNSGSKPNSTLWSGRKQQVKNTFLESWQDYVKHGWGYDVYSPMKQKGKNMGSKPLGWIIVDSLDTLILMDCKEELEDAKSWVDKELDYTIDSEVNVFETTIRMLGGLLSAHYLSDDPNDSIFLEKAVILGNKLVTAFDTPSGIPAVELNLKAEKAGRFGFPALGASVAEIATLQLEFKYLSKLTGEAYFWDAAEKVMSYLDRNQYTEEGVYNHYDGLAPIFINQVTGEFSKDLIRLGSRGDSYYEYLLKQYLQTDEDIYLEMYEHAFNGIKKHLMKESYPNKYVFFGELPNGVGGTIDNKMDHLVCFIGGLFALGATKGMTEVDAKTQPWWNNFQEEQLNTGKELGRTCYHMYHDTPGTHLSPEIVVFNTEMENSEESKRGMISSTSGDFYIKPNDKHNLQRPETVETLYYLYKITKDEKYREWGWEIFQNFITYTKVTDSNGKNPRYSCLKDCTIDPPVFSDNMESFWLAETLKYLYLLFDDDRGSLENGNVDKWDLQNMVFNTEAHPLPKFDGSQFIKKWTRGVGPLNNNAPPKGVKRVIKPDSEKDTTIDMENNDETALLETEKGKENIKKMVSGRNNGVDGKKLGLTDPKLNNIDPEEDNVKVANKMKASGEKPAAKQPVAKPLSEQLEEAIAESDGKLETNAESEDSLVVAEDEESSAPRDVSRENIVVAEKMKASGQKPVAKQEVAKSLDEQLEDAIVERDNKNQESESEFSGSLQSFENYEE